MTQSKKTDVVLALLAAAKARSIATSDAWDYGWCTPEYRNSPDAAATGPDGMRIKFSREGVVALELGIQNLIGEHRIASAWDSDELWGVLTNMISTLPMPASEKDLRSEIESRLSKLVDRGGTFVAFEVANVAPPSSCLTIGHSVFGPAGDKWAVTAQEVAPSRTLSSQFAQLWPARRPNEGATVYGTWVSAYGEKARRQSEERFHDTIALSILLEREPSDHRLFSGRSDSHRPGVRGLTIDREALERLAGAGPDLAASVLSVDPTGFGLSTYWWGQDAFPLERLLRQPGRLATVTGLIEQDTNIARRFRTAARWYAKAHWSKQTDDAVLALGIAFDALLGERGGLPGRALTDRFAFLERDCSLRADRAKRFGEIYSARSAVAHGASSTSADDPAFVKEMARDVRFAAIRLLDLTRSRRVESEQSVRELFESLKWGLVDT